MIKPEDCGHKKVKENGPCPDCGDYIALYEYYNRSNQSFKFDEDGNVSDIFRGSEYAKEVFEFATATQGTYQTARKR